MSHLYKRIIGSILLSLSPVLCANLSGSLSVEAITTRLQPEAKIDSGEVSAPNPIAATKILTPEQIYSMNCIDCHKTGVAGAPKFGDKAAWQPRAAQGKEVLFQHAWHGLRAMPPKGNCLDCTEDEIRKVIDFMLSQ